MKSKRLAVSLIISLALLAIFVTSAFALTWTQQSSGTTQPLRSVAHGGSQFVAVGQSGTILTSPDGTNWTTQTSGTTQHIYSVGYGGSQFVAVGDSGTILTSPDGVTWTARTSGTTQHLRGVVYDGSQFVMTGWGGTILTSSDGVTWTADTSGTTTHLYGVAYNGTDTFVVVGYSDMVLTSGDPAPAPAAAAPTPTPSPEPEDLPDTGFPRGEVTSLPAQPASKAYAETTMMLEIPKLGVEMPIVGVPQSDSGWDVTWLGSSAGYLAGSAFPTWEGNTVLTAHVWDSWNQPVPFSELKTLKYGDQFYIHAWGLTYTYEVRAQRLLFPNRVSSVMEHKDYDWVTLLTCEFYNPFTGDYFLRRSVKAVLVSVD